MSVPDAMDTQPVRCLCRKGAWNPSCPVHLSTAEVARRRLAGLIGAEDARRQPFGNLTAGATGARELDEGRS